MAQFCIGKARDKLLEMKQELGTYLQVYIKRQQRDHGLTQEEIGKILSISETQVARIIHDRWESVSMDLLICAAHNVHIGVVLEVEA